MIHQARTQFTMLGHNPQPAEPAKLKHQFMNIAQYYYRLALGFPCVVTVHSRPNEKSPSCLEFV